MADGMDYESCDVYRIKGADGMCTGGDEQCNECPCFIKNTKVCEEEKRKNIGGDDVDNQKPASREDVITHLQIIYTWASFAREKDTEFMTATHMERIMEWTDDAINLLRDE